MCRDAAANTGCTVPRIVRSCERNGFIVKFRIERDVLTEAVTWTARSLPARPAMPVLAGVRMEATAEGTLVLASFDFEVSARVEVPAQIDTAGTVLVSGRLLADICKALPNKPVDVKLDGTKVSITCGASHFTLITMPTEEYPALPEMPQATGVVDAHVFAEAVAQVTMSASRDETLPLLTAVRVEIDGEKMALMATDRYRLAMREITWNPATPDASSVAQVRARTLSDVAKSMNVGEVTIALSGEGSGSLAGFESAGRRTTSLLVDGDYPPVRRLFPEETTIHAVVDRQALIDATRRVSLVAERNTPVRLSFEDGQVVLEAGQGDDAQASEALEATLQGESISTAFNPHYLQDGLGAINEPFVRLSFTHSSKPVVMTGQKEIQGEDETAFRYLLMPIRFAN